MRRVDADIIIIGSGFGGSVCACRAAQAGLKVILLERGREMTEETFDAMGEGRLPIVHGQDRVGLMDLPRIRGLASMVGCGVGGGSQVYTAVTVPAPDEIFGSGWPAGIDAASMKPHFERVFQMIAPTPVPIALPRTKLLEAVGRRLGATVTRLPQAMNWAPEESLLAEPRSLEPRAWLTTWLRGGPTCRKRTLTQTYLSAAKAAGADIRSLNEAIAITPESQGFCVAYRCLEEGRMLHGRLHARRVVLAAGVFATLRMLLQCRDEWDCLPGISATLGHRVFTNGDMGALLIGDGREMVPDSGPPVTAWLDHWARDRFYLMDLGHVPLPPMVSRVMSLYGLRGPSRGETASNWAFGVMGFDDSPGRLVLERKGTMDFRRGEAAQSSYDQSVMARLQELATMARATLVVPPAAVLGRFAVTVHPLGGASMADSAHAGVTNGHGEVFGYPGLFVADGSVLPTPIGRAPSMTIAALAERIISHVIETQ